MHRLLERQLRKHFAGSLPTDASFATFLSDVDTAYTAHDDDRALLERSIELHDRHFPSLKNLALLYERAGFRHKSVEVWERCVHIAPDAVTKAQVKEHLLRLL